MTQFRYTGMLVVVALLVAGAEAKAQDAGDREAGSAAPRGFSAPDSEKLRIGVRGLLGYGFEPANESQGFGRWGRVGSFIIDLSGRISPRVSYFASINPVDEVAPLPSCGEPTLFMPNDPAFLYRDLYERGIGPDVECDPDGMRRVDMYRGVALDLVDQQGALRELWVKARLGGGVDATFGRMILPIGFRWDAAGSMTAKDAPMIQRINAEANFGVVFTRDWTWNGRRLAGTSVGAVIGEGNAAKDYAYRFFQDGTFDGNKDVTAIASLVVTPIRALDARVSYKGGFTASKIERFETSYFGGGKHNDNALVFGAQFTVRDHNRVTAECARYTWGLADSSATMVGSSPEPVEKNGCYVTLEGGYAVRPGVVVGASYTRESIDRADSMIRYLSERQLYGVREGEKDRLNVVRVFVDLHRRLRAGYFFSAVDNPYPWVSGIYPVEGPSAFTGRALDRWGVILQFTLQ